MGKWWLDQDTLARRVKQAGGFAALSRETGIPASTLKSAWKDKLRPAKDYQPFEPEGPTWLLEILKKAGDKATILELADLADVAPRRVREALDELGETGYRVGEAGDRVTLERVPPAPADQITPVLFDGEGFRVAVISDTHIGSNEERTEELRVAAELAADEGCEYIIHPGDLIAGLGIYRTQVRDVKFHTYDEQVEYAVEVLPNVGLQWLTVSGNHDLEGEAGRIGFDPVRAVAALRDDVTALGEYSAWLELPNGGLIHVLHPGGGASYALSYKPQKLCEGYEAGKKPNLAFYGHYHRRGQFRHREIEAFLCGTFEGSTSLAKRYGMGAPAVGFHIVDGRMADDGSLVRVRSEWFPFYNGRVVV